jgi:phenylpyruvate tautomerase PptA (4-oxalocrotonate tautomerase family)
VAIYKCLVNGEIDERARQAVIAGLAEVEASPFGTPADDLRVSFTEIEAGLWFTAGKPSKASMVLGTVPEGTSQAVRAEIMEEVARRFSEATGADLDHVMVVAADPKTTTGR